ncbi:MAG: ABC transporter ATP-binding protein [SAR202 cluster bacterium]|nr:ABC transporter ATP-binding protein [SAR202 cluster bacterium]
MGSWILSTYRGRCGGSAMMHGMWHRRQQEKPSRVTRALVFRAASYLIPYWRPGLIVLVTVIAMAFLALTPALLIRTVIDVAIPDKRLLLLLLLALGMIAAPGIAGIVSVIQTRFSAYIAQSIVFDLRTSMFSHLQTLSLRFFTQAKTGEVMSRLSNDVSNINRVVTDTITQSVMQVFVLISTISVILLMEWRLALVALAVLPFAVGSARRVGRRRYKLQKESQTKLADLNAIMQETLNVAGFLLMKAFVKETYERIRFGNKAAEVMDVQIRTNMLGRWFRMILQVLEAIGPALVYLYGGYLVMQGEMSLGTLVAFATLLVRLYQPMSQLANVHVEIMGSLALFERIFEYLDVESDVVESQNAIPLAIPAKGRIGFYDVGFQYIPDRWALHGVSFTAEPGQLVALVGPTGAGKTTATYLIPRLYDITEGSITVDDVDVREIKIHSLRDQMGIVTQETYLFNASVRDNLLYADEKASDQQILDACRVARFDDVVNRMPNALDTIVGERGYRLSGGEKQRLAIARVLLKNPRILVLDEATSSLDSQTELQIQEAMQPLMRGRTTVAIAHRLSTVLAADKIIVLDEGKLIEAGTHSELISKNGLYSTLYEIQFKPQLSGALHTSI